MPSRILENRWESSLEVYSRSGKNEKVRENPLWQMRDFRIGIMYEFPARWENVCGDIRVNVCGDLGNGRGLRAVFLSIWEEMPSKPGEVWMGELIGDV